MSTTATARVIEMEEGRLLSLSGVSVRYEQEAQPTLHDIDFSIHSGESVLFLGPSGCGKSTLAMVCANLLPGAIEGVVTGQVERHPALAVPGAVGYVFQDPDAQFCMLTVGDEVAFGLENQRVAPSDMPQVTRRALRQAGLDVQLPANHATFSGGMKQKLAVACALAMDAPLVVFDEPTANLDPKSTRQVFDVIAALRASGRTLIVIEHKFEPLLAQMDRVVLFTRDGRIHRTGPAAQVVSEEWAWLVEEGIAKPNETALSGPGTRAPREPSGQPVLSVRSASLKYGQTPVWDDISLDVYPGTITAIVGPNGGGKSSLLQVMAGLQKPTHGQVALHGQAITAIKRSARAQAISYCFQNPEYQFIYERVADEVANRMVEHDVPEDARALLQLLGLEGAAQQSPFALSQGQKRRLSVAVMLKEDHDLYLLDEPTFGQDAQTEAVLMEKFASLRETGKAVVMTTHDMSLVARYADQVAVLVDGSISFVGAPALLWENERLMHRAHLLDDQAVDTEPEAARKATGHELGPASTAPSTVSHTSTAPSAQMLRRRGLGPHWNAPVFLMAIFAAALAAIFANHLPQAIAVFLWPVLLGMTVFRISPFALAKRLSAFIGFYVLYTWSYVAFTRVPPGVPVIHLLWMHPSLSGLMTGLVLAFRMLAAVVLGIVFLSASDLTDLVVGWSTGFGVAPKFTYGMLAGLHFMPLFRTEWTKLRQARQLRGKDAPFALARAVTYALPLLGQAIRLSERVAIAMEARGLTGVAATDATARTYARAISLSARDWLLAAVFVASFVAIVAIVP
ncbi:ATP-binding cassette domain-containing protein [Alicyclobacillus sp. ALC3]|uniref:ATP-binding cassette domain-containing protein n=1 Tax=Alicyclobacillus sp. ALC3 TaxID=2796143 RepID=UPI00237894B5|nr:ATP-binding cassette domain-containing protein [Alicyclobacillus sp. ALC3]WDL98260.1 ATP-binding cassette domain-containing protein [Alicyclobacillus sp. ALC3]